PSVLRERESDYVVNPKGLASPYMMLAFATNPKRRDEITAAVHPHDGTARAHLGAEAGNPGNHRGIRGLGRRWRPAPRRGGCGGAGGRPAGQRLSAPSSPPPGRPRAARPPADALDTF